MRVKDNPFYTTFLVCYKLLYDVGPGTFVCRIRRHLVRQHTRCHTGVADMIASESSFLEALELGWSRQLPASVHFNMEVSHQTPIRGL